LSFKSLKMFGKGLKLAFKARKMSKEQKLEQLKRHKEIADRLISKLPEKDRIEAQKKIDNTYHKLLRKIGEKQ